MSLLVAINDFFVVSIATIGLLLTETMSSRKIPKQKTDFIELNNGELIPPIGFGAYAGFKMEAAVQDAIDAGFRLIDTAFIQRNEHSIGEILKLKISQQQIDRKELYVVSKLWITLRRPEYVLPALQLTLKNLQLNYLDLFLMHWPMAIKPEYGVFQTYGLEDDISILSTWRAMEQCVEMNLTKSIGVANFNYDQLIQLYEAAKIKPAVSQVEANIFMYPQKMLEVCNERNIVVMAANPLFGPARALKLGHLANMYKVGVVRKLSNKYHKDCAQILLRYLIQLGMIPLPNIDNKMQMELDLEVFDFKINDLEVKELKQIHQNLRLIELDACKHLKTYPFNGTIEA